LVQRRGVWEEESEEREKGFLGHKKKRIRREINLMRRVVKEERKETGGERDRGGFLGRTERWGGEEGNQTILNSSIRKKKWTNLISRRNKAAWNNGRRRKVF